MWVQSSPEGGKFEHSDVFVALDFRIPFQATMLLREDEKLDGHGALDLFEYKCAVSMGSPEEGSIDLMYHTYDAPPDADSIYTWQFAMADYCRDQNLHSAADCLRAISQIYHCMHIRNRLHREGLPAIQELPEPERPFVFLHVEKVGGTSLRR